MVELSTIEAGEGGFVINGVSAGDFAGTSVRDAGDVNGDGLADLIIGARQDDPNGASSGASFVVFGTSSTAAIELSDIEAGTGGFVINGVGLGDQSGNSVSGAGDVNGDGLADLIVGAYLDDPNASSAGASFVVFGKSTTTAVRLADVQAGTGGFVINGVASGDRSGESVSKAGDVNGDGRTDLIIGAPYDDPNGGNSGASFVVFGKTTTTAVELSDIDAGTGGFTINGVAAGDLAGVSVRDAGDVNGDGKADLIIGARFDDPNGSDSGASFVVFGKATTTTVELSDIDAGTGGFTINGVAMNNRAGRSVDGAGDVNGDGIDDLIVGADGASPNGLNSGASYVVFGKSTTTTVELSDVEAGTGGFVINGVSADDRSGYSVNGAGDVNGDGKADVIIGARYDDPNGSRSGAAFVVYGKSDTTAVELSNVEAGTGGFVLNGVSADDLAGASVSAAGDVNGDGGFDVIIGARGDDPNGGASGASFVIFGTPAPVTSVTTTTPSDDLPSTNVVTAADGTASFTLDNNTGATARGVLIENTGNGNIVAVNLPNRAVLASSGTAAAQETTPATITLASQISGTADASNGADLLLSGAADFMAGRPAGALFDVRTLTPTVSGSAAFSGTIQIAGSTSGSGEEAFVIDTRSMPTGAAIQLDDIDFAAIIGEATVTGGDGPNFVVGDGSDQSISLGALDDTLIGGGGNDTIGSRFGEDILYGNTGDDAVRGGGGMDTLFGGQGNDAVDGENDADTLFGNLGSDTLNGGQGADAVYGNLGFDTVSGGTQADSLFGGQGDDIVYGNTEADILWGNNGADVLYGGQGSDTLSGGAGADTLVGGGGADTFVIGASSEADTVLDFRATDGDRLQVDIDGTTITTLADLPGSLTTDASGALVIGIGAGDSLTFTGLTSADIAGIAVDLVSDGVTIATGKLDGTETVAATIDTESIPPPALAWVTDNSPLLAATKFDDAWW